MAEVVRVLAAGRQGYLDALPIAAALIAFEDEEPFIECANEHFRFVAEWDERMGENRVAQVPILGTGKIDYVSAGKLALQQPAPVTA